MSRVFRTTGNPFACVTGPELRLITSTLADVPRHASEVKMLGTVFEAEVITISELARLPMAEWPSGTRWVALPGVGMLIVRTLDGPSPDSAATIERNEASLMASVKAERARLRREGQQVEPEPPAPVKPSPIRANLSPVQRHILDAIAECGTMMKDGARLVGYSRATGDRVEMRNAAKALDVLRRLGLITRTHESDGRLRYKIAD